MTLTRSYWPADTSESVTTTTVGDLLRDAAADAPEMTALIAGRADPARRRSWTYAELLADAEQAARALLEHVSPGERIAIWAPNVPEWMILEFAAALAGVTVVALSPLVTDPDLLAHALAQSDAVALFYLAKTPGQDMTDVVDRLRSRLPELRETVPLSGWAGFVSRADPDRRLPNVPSRAAAHIPFTSGTTGHSVGVVQRHEAIVNNASFAFQRMRLGRGETVLLLAPICHGAAFAFCVPGVVSRRAALVLPDDLDAGLVLELLEVYRVQMLFTVPTRLAAVAEDPAVRRRDLRALRTVVSAAAPSRPDLIQIVESAFHCKFVNVYGQTEASAIATGRPANGTRRPADTVGPPLPQAECKIIDAGSGQITDLGCPGELCIRGYQVMIEYLGAPEETAKRIDPQGWLHTGDMAVFDEQGNLTVVGRARDVIKRGTEEIFPREIENCLYRHPAVGDAIVLGIPDLRWGEQIIAVIRPAAGCYPTPAELRAYCLRHLPSHKAPVQWYYVDTLPLCGPGKIKKYELRENILAGQLRPADTSS